MDALFSRKPSGLRRDSSEELALMSNLRLTAASTATAGDATGSGRASTTVAAPREMTPRRSVGTSSLSSSRVEAWLEESARASVGEADAEPR